MRIPVLNRESKIEYYDGIIVNVCGRRLAFFKFEGAWACSNPENGGVYLVGEESFAVAKQIMRNKIVRRLMPPKEVEDEMREVFEKANIEG